MRPGGRYDRNVRGREAESGVNPGAEATVAVGL